MLAKRYLTISLLLPLVAISATAHAGSTNTDKSYWPSAATPAIRGAAGDVERGSHDVFASNTMARPNGGAKFQVTHPGGR